MNARPQVRTGTKAREGEFVAATNAYEMLVQGVVDYAIFMLDPDGYVASWSAGAEQIKGYTKDEIIGAHLSRFYTDEDRAAGAPERALRAAAETGRFSAEGWRQRKDGSRFWAMVVIDAVRQHGKLIGFAKVTRDMTEQRKAQQASLESERRFRLLVQGVTDYAIFMLDPTGKVTNWNTGAQRIKGYTESEIVGQHFSRFYPAEDADAGLPHRALETARQHGRYAAEGWRVRKDGTRFWASVVLDAIYDGDTLIGFAKITRDLTERRQAELELEQSREALAHSQKMEAIGQLTGGLAHDFNNLLTGISGSLEILRNRIGAGRLEGIERYIAAAETAAERAAALTHRLLAFSRRQTLDPKPTQANALVLGMQDLIQRTVGPAISIHLRLDPDLWMTRCDPNQLENALLNLCINARDAMPNGGDLVIETRRVETDVAPSMGNGASPGQYVEIAATDNGIGMTEEVARRAFDPFFTTKPLGEGTGLGLSMVYGFARQSEGDVQIQSTEGVGTTVRITLPRHDGASEPAEAPEPPPAMVRADAGRTVLVVDDETTVRLLITEVLEDHGYIAVGAADGAAALRVLRSDLPIDLLITDVGLPGGLNGRQVADAARSLRPGLEVLFITGYAEGTVLAGSALEEGMHVLTKPFNLDALVRRVGSLVAAEPASTAFP